MDAGSSPSAAAGVAGASGSDAAGAGGGGIDDVVQKARSLMRKIVAGRPSPEPCLLHSLAVILEQEESRYEEQVGHPYTINSRSSHNIGRLVDLIREDDDFFDLISLKCLVDAGHSTDVRAAAARLLLACTSCWVLIHDFEERVLVNIKQWVLEDVASTSNENVWERNGAKSIKLFNTADREMLKTYATGLLAIALQQCDIVDDVLSTGMVAKLMHYLRVRVLGDSGITGDGSAPVENRSSSGIGSSRVRDEPRGRVRPSVESGRMDDFRGLDRSNVDLSCPHEEDGASELSTDVEGSRKDEQTNTEEIERRSQEPSDLGLQPNDGDEDGEDLVSDDKRRRKDRNLVKRSNSMIDRLGQGRASREDDEELGRAEPSKRRSDIRERSLKGKGKSRTGDAPSDVERSQTPSIMKTGSQGDHTKIQRSLQDRVNGKSQLNTDPGKARNIIKGAGGREFDTAMELSIEDDVNTPSVLVGNADIGNLIHKASRAAVAEASAANAPLEAIRAAGDAAAELVRVAALEQLAANGSDEVAILAAARAAAATVVDAAEAIHVSDMRGKLADADKRNKELPEQKDHQCELGENGACGIDMESLAKLRERFCVQCLEKMGEYMEVLGPVLQEQGVDVCLALLQRQSKENTVKDMTFLSDILKLVCSLAAHRKFASLFVDRGGVQQLIAAPRVPQTLTGISLCLFALASLQGVMERVCTLPPTVVQEMVALGLVLLGCPQDPARRHAALFFGASFVFRAILDAFDGQDGLQKVLNVLRNAVHLRSGGGSAGASSVSLSIMSRADRGLAAEVLTSSGKQIAYHTCVALRQYFKAHLLKLVDSIRPLKGHRGGSRNSSNARAAAYKPADISNEAMDTIILQLQRDRKLGPAFVRSHWTELEKFMSYGGHTILLELTQGSSSNERYLHEISQNALGVLQIVTLIPSTRKPVVGSVLSNERTGMAVILDAASGAGVNNNAEVIQAALLVLVNLVCPPPSLCSRPVLSSSTTAVTTSHTPHSTHSQPVTPGSLLVGTGSAAVQAANVEGRDRGGRAEVYADRNGSDRAGTAPHVLIPGVVPAATTPVVGDRRISLGPGAGGSGLAAYMEQGYRYAREAVRANNGIKVLLHPLYHRQLFLPGSLDCIRALACRVLYGLALDNAIAHILTKLQVGKMLSELLRDGTQAGRQAGASSLSGEQGRWQAELSGVALDLIAIVTSAGRASTVAASEAAAPTLRRIERAAIAAATPVSYHSRELLQLIHEHLVASGLQSSASELLREAQFKPLSSTLSSSHTGPLSAPAGSSLGSHQWPSGRVVGGPIAIPSKILREEEDLSSWQISSGQLRKKLPALLSAAATPKTPGTTSGLSVRRYQFPKDPRQCAATRNGEQQDSCCNGCGPGHVNGDVPDNAFKTPTSASFRSPLPLKRKASDKDLLPVSPSKKLAQFESGFSAPVFTPPSSRLKNSLMIDTSFHAAGGVTTPGQSDLPSRVSSGIHASGLAPTFERSSETAGPAPPSDSFPSGEAQLSCPTFYSRYQGTPVPLQAHHSSLPPESRVCPSERMTLDSLVVQYLKHQHRQCPAPITTLPPLSLLHPHVCPEPNRTLDAPFNTTVRLASREMRAPFGGLHGRRHDRHFVYSRFRPWRTCRDETAMLTACTFLGPSSCLAAGSHEGDVRFFDSSSGDVMELHMCHQSPITLLQSSPRSISFGGEGLSSHPGQLLLSSATYEVRLWDGSMMGNGPMSVFDSCKAARFNHSGSRFGAVALDPGALQKEVLLYDVSTCKLEQRLSDISALASLTSRSHTQAMVHFSPSDALVLWSGVLWDHRIPRAIHRFDQFSDYGGGGFHPGGNEIIINSEVWDMRSFKLLRSVPSLDQTSITFNATGDIIYATLRRNSDDLMAALNPRRTRHPLFAAFRTMDAVDYSDIATTPVERCVLDLAAEPTDSFIAVVSIDSNEEMASFAKLYEVGRRKPTDDDSDPECGSSDTESDGDDDDDDDGDDMRDNDDSDVDLMSNDEDPSMDDDDDLDDDGDLEFGDSSDDEGSDDGLGGGIMELYTGGEDGPPRGPLNSGDFSDDVLDHIFNSIL